MKLLLLIPQNVIPPVDGGKIGIYMPMKLLAQRHTVKAIVFCAKNEKMDKTPYTELGVDVTFAIVKKDDSLKLILENIVQVLPFKFKKYYNSEFQDIINKLCNEWKPDALICHHAHLAKYCTQLKNKFPSIQLILREHNVEYLLVKQYFQTESNILKKAIAFWQYKKTEKYEKKCWNYFDVVAFISDSDFKCFNPKAYLSRGTVIYDGTSTVSHKIKNATQLKTFLFTGSVKSFQNKYNLQYFIKAIWIPWKEKTKEASAFELWITGDRNIDYVKKELNISDNDIKLYKIKILGFVDNITETMQNCDYFLSPTVIGAGIRIKVLEALAEGCVIFLTQKDLEMTKALTNEQNVLLYDDLESFQKQITKISGSSILYRNLSLDAIKTSQQYFTWEIFYEKTLQLLKKNEP